jgi:hypothetical protein
MTSLRVASSSKVIFFAQALFLTVLVTLAMLILSSCGQIPGITYSVEDQFALARARAPELASQLQFSFRLDPESVPVEQDISFVATFTNTTDHPIIFREPKQNNVMAQEYFETLLLFSVEPTNENISILFPEQGLIQMINKPVAFGEFVTLPAHTSREIRLMLPRKVQIKNAPPNVFAIYSAEYFSLPVGQYHVQITYINDVIGNEVKIPHDIAFVDLHAWVGRIESSPVLLTITP